MTNEFEDSPLEVRIPVRYFDMLMDGEITGSMLLTMGMLYRWSDWGNGKVKKVSASGLATATADSFHKNTYQDALQRWEQMGEIERHMTLGSHKSYPVTIHNYRKQVQVRDKVTKDLVWKACTINKWKTVTYKEFQDGIRADALDGAPTEGMDEGMDEGVYEAPTEGVERTCISEHEPASDLQEDLQEDLHESLHNEHQQQQSKGRAEAAAPSGRNSKPNTEKPTFEPETPVEPDTPACTKTEITCELTWSRFLAAWLGIWLGIPPKSVPRKWEQDMQEMDTLLSSYAPELVLWDILDWMVVSEDQKAAKFREKIQAAQFSPTGLLKTIITDVVDAYYLCLSQEKVITLEQNIKDLLGDNEPYSRYDGDKLRAYRFMESKLRPPCWYVLVTKEEKPEAPGWSPVPVDIAVGLDLPFPLDGTPQDELTKADLDYRKTATDPEPCDSPTKGGLAREPIPPQNPNGPVVNSVIQRKETIHYLNDPDGSLHGLTAEEARTLGLPLDEQEELLGDLGIVENEEEVGQSESPVPVPEPIPEPPRLPARKEELLHALRAKFLGSKYPDLARDTESLGRLAARWATLGQETVGGFEEWMESRSAAATAA